MTLISFTVIHEHPSLHHQQVLMAHALAATKAVGSYLLGLPYTVSSADNWLRNMRMMNRIAEDIGCRFLAFLQPAMGVGPFEPSPDERRIMEEQLDRVKFAHGGPYLDAARRHYDVVRGRLGEHPFVIDITDVFAGESDVYAEYRHPNDRGHRLIAERHDAGAEGAGDLVLNVEPAGTPGAEGWRHEACRRTPVLVPRLAARLVPQSGRTGAARLPERRLDSSAGGHGDR